MSSRGKSEYAEYLFRLFSHDLFSLILYHSFRSVLFSYDSGDPPIVTPHIRSNFIFCS